MPDHRLHRYEVLHNKLSGLEVLPVDCNPVEIQSVFHNPLVELAVYKKCCWDMITILVTLISLEIAIYFGDWIKTVLPINMLFLLLLVQLVYVGIRWYVKGWRETRGYY